MTDNPTISYMNDDKEDFIIALIQNANAFRDLDVVEYHPEKR